MKFSVLLPTRNRLEYLRYAVATVRRQSYSNWEIIVSDNDSEDDIAGYVESLGDERIRYVRTERLIPVTDNWNNALSYSNGDYVVMLGDDDGLLPEYFSTLLKAFKSHPGADYVYVGGYFFAYRGALPEEPAGFLRRDRNRCFTQDEPYWLDRATAKRIAHGYLDFRMPVASNMQFSVISRRMIEQLTRDGPFFRSPFPDFYATPLLFLRSQRVLICSTPMVVVGITPKSYGAFHFSDRAAEGVKFLGNAQQLDNASRLQSVMLPGTSYNDSWLLAMDALRATCAKSSVRPNLRRYRFLQIVHCYKARYFERKVGAANLDRLRAKMSAPETILFGLTMPLGFTLLRAVPGDARQRIVSLLRRLLGQHAIGHDAVAASPYANLLDVFEAIDERRPLAGGTAHVF